MDADSSLSEREPEDSDFSSRELLLARGIARSSKSSALRALFDHVRSVAGDEVPQAVAEEAAERMVAALILRRRMEDHIMQLGTPPSGPSKEHAARRAAFNATVNAWRTAGIAFDDAVKLIRSYKKRQIRLSLPDMLLAAGKQVPVTEIELTTEPASQP